MMRASAHNVVELTLSWKHSNKMYISNNFCDIINISFAFVSILLWSVEYMYWHHQELNKTDHQWWQGLYLPFTWSHLPSQNSISSHHTATCSISRHRQILLCVELVPHTKMGNWASLWVIVWALISYFDINHLSERHVHTV